MSAHTPGPWVANGSAIETERPRGQPSEFIAGHIDNDANARLIAAAPDLLALVSEFEVAVSLNYLPNRIDTLHALATRARSLLATVTP